MAALDGLSKRVFSISDPKERAAVVSALQGPGKPAGVRSCEAAAGTLTVLFDERTTPSKLIHHLVEIERRRFASPPEVQVGELNDRRLAHLVAEATGDPELDENRILEHLVPELDS